jgi:hypothetical protein
VKGGAPAWLAITNAAGTGLSVLASRTVPLMLAVPVVPVCASAAWTISSKTRMYFIELSWVMFRLAAEGVWRSRRHSEPTRLGSESRGRGTTAVRKILSKSNSHMNKDHSSLLDLHQNILISFVPYREIQFDVFCVTDAAHRLKRYVQSVSTSEYEPPPGIFVSAIL